MSLEGIAEHIAKEHLMWWAFIEERNATTILEKWLQGYNHNKELAHREVIKSHNDHHHQLGNYRVNENHTHVS